MIFTYLQCLIDCRDCLVLVSPIKTRFLATVGGLLYFISYYIFFRNKTISNYTVNFYLYDKLELALSFNYPPPPPTLALPLLVKALMLPLILRLQAAISVRCYL